MRERGARSPAAPRHGLSSDAALASRVRHGDRRALRMLYGRYAGEIFDFAVPVTGAAEAAAVVADTFTAAWDRLRVGVKPPRAEPWLLGIAYAAALERAPGRQVTWPGGGSGSGGVVADSARQWAETLTPREYALVDLYIRRGLSVKELAAITGIAERSVRDRLERLGTSLERFTACELVLRRPVTCAGLSVLLERIRGAGDADRRRAVQQHAKLCEACGGAAGRAGSSLAAFAELPTAPWGGGGGGATWAIVASHAAGNLRGSAEGGPSAARRPRRSRGLLVAAAGAACMLAAALAVVLDPFGGGAGESERRADSGSVMPRIGSATSVFEPPVASSPARQQREPGQAKPGGETRRGASGAAKAASTPAGQDAEDAKPRPKPEPSRPSAKPAPAAPPPAAQDPPAAAQTEPRPTPAPTPAAPSPRSRTLAWAPVAGAAGYEVVLQRDGQEVFKARTKDARLVLPAGWTYRGRPVKLQTGYYRWIVWPLESGQRKAEQAVVVSNLHVD